MYGRLRAFTVKVINKMASLLKITQIASIFTSRNLNTVLDYKCSLFLNNASLNQKSTKNITKKSYKTFNKRHLSQFQSNLLKDYQYLVAKKCPLLKTCSK